ncbi:MAG: hypothetical protein K0S47_3123 [Herbinix sp.]|jgi:hypothetical protein|nr:hypothetical protein [Herbinix sp.]
MAKKNMKKEEVAVEVKGAVVEDKIDTKEDMVVDTVVVEEGLGSEQITAEVEPEQQESGIEEIPLLPQDAVINSEGIAGAFIDDGMVESEEAVILSDEASLLESVTADNEELPNFEQDIMEDIQQEETVVVNNNEVSLEIDNMATSVVFRSDSEMARTYIMELLSDGDSHKKQEIVAYISKRAGKEFTEATVINVLRNLINRGDLLQLERGSYKVGSGIGLASKLLQFVDATRKGLEKITTISISDINETDLAVVKDVKELRGLLNDIFDRLSLGSN